MSTFVGGAIGFEWTSGLEVDDLGFVYVGGSTDSSDYPTTAGAFEETFTGPLDSFITKLSPAGSSLIFSSFLPDTEIGTIAVDSLGDIYMASFKAGLNFPTTAGVFDQGPYAEASGLTKFDSSGSSLIWSTYVIEDTTGLNANGPYNVAIDSNKNPIVVGRTNETLPIAPAGFDQSFNGGPSDCFAMKFNSTATALIYSTYIGGNGDCNTSTGDLVVDDTDALFVSGFTTATNFPVTAGAFDETYNGGTSDAFLVKLNPAGTAFEFATYLGGSGAERTRGRTGLGTSGNIYLTGETFSGNFPFTADALDNTVDTTFRDGFLTVLNPTGDSLVYSSALGGSNGLDYGLDEKRGERWS